MALVNDSASESGLAAEWLVAAADPDISCELEAVYQIVRDAVEARGPACWASGRCCNFRGTGHLLYVTGLEAAFTLSGSGRTLDPGELEAAISRGDCPFLTQNLCGVHGVKPLGCRVYFCDATAQGWQQDLSERALRMVRGIHDRHGLEYRYGEWRAMLRRFVV